MINSSNDTLYEACRSGNKELAISMINRGATNLNRGLEYACCFGHKDIVELMLSHGANEINYGLTNACVHDYRDIILLLIEKGANEFNGGLDYACFGRHTELALLLIEKGANIDLCYLALTDSNIYYLAQKGVSNLGKYEGVADAFHESHKILPTILNHILSNDLTSLILEF